MNANEAHLMTLMANSENVSAPRAAVDILIEQSAKKGRAYACYFDAAALQEITKQKLIRSLEDDGYKVRYVADPDPGNSCSRSYHEISW